MTSLLLWTLLFAFGVIFLVKGADLLVSGGASLALRFGVPALIIGMTLVAFGTSLPEMASSINATLKGHTEMAVGNIIGSIIANTFLVIGVSSIIRPLKVKEGVIKKEIPFMMGAMVLMLLFSMGGFIQRWQGGLLVIFLIFFIFYMIRETHNSHERTMVIELGIVKEGSTKIDALKVIVGIICVIIGAELMISSAVFYMGHFGLSESVIGLSMVALATSLPELAISSIASLKKEHDISMGNVIGSNIFNILMVIGICALILPLKVSVDMFIDILIMMGVGLVLVFIIYLGNKISRLEGLFMVAFYVFYLVYLYMP